METSSVSASARSKFFFGGRGVSGSEDRSGGDNSIQFINIRRVGDKTYQAFYSLKHYNLMETRSFLIRKQNQPTSYLMLQLKSKNTLKSPFNSSFK